MTEPAVGPTGETPEPRLGAAGPQAIRDAPTRKESAHERDREEQGQDLEGIP